MKLGGKKDWIFCDEIEKWNAQIYMQKKKGRFYTGEFGWLIAITMILAEALFTAIHYQ